jgi:hypothetical protein
MSLSEKGDILSQVENQSRRKRKVLAQLGISRSTYYWCANLSIIEHLPRYREQGEKRAISIEARIRVTQEALSKHFADLCQTCERFQNGIIRYKPEEAIIEDIQTSHVLTKMLSGRRGDEVKVVLRVSEGKAKVDRLSIEEELLFASLKQHTKNLDFWPLFKEWKDKSGEYISNLSSFYHLLRQQAIEETGLEIAHLDGNHGLTFHFAYSIFKDTCDHTFFGYKGFEGVDYTIHPLNIDGYELRFDGFTIALAGDKGQLGKSQEVHRRIMDYFRVPNNQPEELRNGADILSQLEGLESEINLALQKLVLKRNFLGRCELCPD